MYCTNYTNYVARKIIDHIVDIRISHLQPSYSKTGEEIKINEVV